MTRVAFVPESAKRTKYWSMLRGTGEMSRPAYNHCINFHKILRILSVKQISKFCARVFIVCRATHIYLKTCRLNDRLNDDKSTYWVVLVLRCARTRVWDRGKFLRHCIASCVCVRFSSLTAQRNMQPFVSQSVCLPKVGRSERKRNLLDFTECCAC